MYWLAIYENHDDAALEIKHRKFLVDLAMDDLSTKSNGIRKNVMFQLFNENIFPWMASDRIKLARNLRYFISAVIFVILIILINLKKVDMKIFKEYLKKSDRYFPFGELQALNLIQNLLEDGFSFQGLKYVKKLVDYYETEKEYDIIKNIGDKYLNKKIIQALTSELFFDKAYTLVLVLWKSKF